MMAEHRRQPTPRTHTVRPRWTWIALLVLLLGLVVLAWGVILGSWDWSGVGLAVLVVGGLLAVYGGFFYDVQSSASPRAQFHDVVEGNEHQFPAAGTMRSERELKRDVRRRWLGRP
ncbi:hypothetical protein [Nocardioides cynanchi]|jgi:hypothetical protein|uniref:hypothetical protein n=1 Tax=Nocardioides cynanchi TaxID=2558918 RepID=UPI001249293A|nr:hypothetical protein [Nocardioides cynanchi]